MITARNMTRLEVWSDFQCLGGVRIAILSPTVCSARETTAGDDQLTFNIPLGSSGETLVVEHAIIRVNQDQAGGKFDEWVVSSARRQSSAGMVQVTCDPSYVALLQRRGGIVSQTDGAGVKRFDIDLVGLTPTQILDNFVVPTLSAAGLGVVFRGTVDPTAPMDLTLSWDTPLSVVRKICDALSVEFQFTRVGAASGYNIDILNSIGSGAAVADVRVKKNLLEASQQRNADSQATRAWPRGSATDGTFHATIAEAMWQITAINAGTGQLTLADPVGGDGPFLHDQQFNGYTIRKAAGGSPSYSGGITDCDANLQTLQIPSTTGFAVGDLIQFRMPDNSQVTSIAAKTGIELGSDGGLEAGTAAGWSLSTGWSLDTTNPRTGVYCLKHVSGSFNTSAIGPKGVSCKPGDKLYAEGYLKGVGITDGTAKVRIRWLDATGATLGVSQAALPVTADGAYHRSSVLGTAPASTASGVPEFRVDTAQTNGTWYADDLSIQAWDVDKSNAVFDSSDIPATNNVIPNPACRIYTVPTSLPDGWAAIGGVTASKNTNASFYKTAGASTHVTCSAAGQGTRTPAGNIFPSATNPYISGYATIYVVSGQVKVQLLITQLGGGTIRVPASPAVASSTKLLAWEDLGVAGENANTTPIGVAVALEITSLNGAAEFYIDAVQATQSASQQPFVEGSGGTRLWQAANDFLRTNGGPAVIYDVPMVDLERLDGVTYAGEPVTLGCSVKVKEDRIPLSLTTRVLGIERDYINPGNTKVTLSTLASDLSGTLGRPSKPPRQAPIAPSGTSGTGTGSDNTPIPAPALTLSYETEETTSFPQPVLLISLTMPANAADTEIQVRKNGNSYATQRGGTQSPIRVHATWNATYDVQLWIVNRAGIKSTAPSTASLTLPASRRFGRDIPFLHPTTHADDGFALHSTSNDGFSANTSVKESGGKAINRLLAKVLLSDPDSLDGTPEGTTFKRVTSNAINGSSQIDFTKTGFAGKQLTNIADDGLYMRQTLVGSGMAPDVDNGNFELSASMLVASGQTIATPPGWKPNGAGLSACNYNTATPYSGNRSVQVVATSQFGGIASIKYWRVTPGEYYRIEARARSVSGGSDTANVQFWFGDKNGGYTGGVQAGTLSGAFINVVAVGQVPANSVLGHIELTANGPSGGTVEFDEVHITRVLEADLHLQRSNTDTTKIGTVVGQIDNTGQILNTALARGRIYTAGSKPAVIIARCDTASASYIGARLTALGYSVTDPGNNTSTVATCRQYDIAVIDYRFLGADTWSSFIGQLLDDGQKVLVSGNDSGTGLFYITSSVAGPSGGSGGQGQPVRLAGGNHPVCDGWTALPADTDTGLQATGLAGNCFPILKYGSTGNYEAWYAMYPSGGVLYHDQSLSQICNIHTTDSDAYLMAVIEWLGGGLMKTLPNTNGASLHLDRNGPGIKSAVVESGGKAINRLLAKALSGDPDSLDGTPEGTTFKRIISSRVSSSKPIIDFTEQIHINQIAGGGNLLPNSSFEGGAGSWTVYDNGPGPSSFSASSAAPYHGGLHARVTWTAQPSDTMGVRYVAHNQFKTGRWYVLSWYAKNNANLSVGMGAYYNHPPNVEDVLLNPNLTTSYQRYARRLFWNVGAVIEPDIFLSILRGNCPATGTLDIDAVQIEEGQYPTAYKPREDELHGTNLDGNASWTFTSQIAESGGKRLNRILAKPLAADPDTLDANLDGVTYKRVQGVSSGVITDSSVAKNVGLGYYDNGNKNASFTLDWNNGNIQQVTLTGAVATVTLSNPAAGRVYTIVFVQDGTGGRAMPGFSPTLRWGDAGTPTWNTGANKINVISLLYNGSVYLAINTGTGF